VSDEELSEEESSEEEVVGLETQPQKLEREDAEAQLKLKASLIDREELVLERVALRINQIDWAVIGHRDFDDVDDDLTKIEGIDSFVEKKLNALEIKTYEQISRMDDINMKVINDAIEFPPDRILKQDWIEKANNLSL
jgi:predicted flap endonuclease-1-like 5' DNA nuclease